MKNKQIGPVDKIHFGSVQVLLQVVSEPLQTVEQPIKINNYQCDHEIAYLLFTDHYNGKMVDVCPPDTNIETDHLFIFTLKTYIMQ